MIETNVCISISLLQGMPDDYLAAHLNKEGTGKPGQYTIALKYPVYFPVQKKCVIPETRKTMQTAFDSRCKDTNAVLLEEAAKLRQEQALLLGFATHSDYALQLRMAKDQATVAAFLEDLGKKLRPSFEREIEMFTKYKAEDAAEHGFENDGKINMWDFRYYMNMAAEKFYSVDHEKLKV